MPNWCRNTLVITKGEPKPVFDVLRTDDCLFDFNNLVPMPREVADAPVDGSVTVPEWYRWSCQNWGTKWNAVYAEYSATSPDNTIHFDTAWAPPVPVFEALAQRFPQHEFTIFSDEWMNHFHDRFNIKDGVVVWTRGQCSCDGYGETAEETILTAEAEAELCAAFGAEEAK